MIKPEFPKNEIERIKALNGFDIIDTIPEKEYDEITRIAAQICKTPISLISLVDPKRQWFKSRHGLDATETPREMAFCAHAINKPNEILIVPDARKDKRFHDNPLTIDNPNVIFYAGAPLNTSEGFSLGTLCVIDNKPRSLSNGQIDALKALANHVINLLELRKKNKFLKEKRNETNKLNAQLTSFAYRLSHELKTPLRGVKTIVSWFLEEYGSNLDNQGVEWLDLIASRLNYMDGLMKEILKYAKGTNDKIVYELFEVNELILEVKENIDINSKSILKIVSPEYSMEQSKIVFYQVFQNLISNSIKFAKNAQCKIVVSVIETENGYEINYSDDGPGIDPQYEHKIFEPFETISGSSGVNLGIGLAMVKTIINRLGGTIELIENKKMTGACFRMFFPKAKINLV